MAPANGHYISTQVQKHTDWDLLQRYSLQLADSKEFFIQKAIGWAMRQYSKFAPEVVRSFIQSHELAPLSRREGMKHLHRKKVSHTINNAL